MKACGKNLDILKELRDFWRGLPEEKVAQSLYIVKGYKKDNDLELHGVDKTVDLVGALTLIKRPKRDHTWTNAVMDELSLDEAKYLNFVFECWGDSYRKIHEMLLQWVRMWKFTKGSEEQWYENDSRTDKEVGLDRLDLLIADIEYDLFEVAA